MQRLSIAVAVLVFTTGTSHAAESPCEHLISASSLDAAGGFAIVSPGYWCLEDDLAIPTTLTRGGAITIQVDSVTLDLQGYRIEQSPSSNFAVGIYGAGRRNIHVRNGSIRGFFIGLELWGDATTPAAHAVVEDVTVDSASTAGILVIGSENVVRRCTVFNTNPSASPTYAAAGIQMMGNVNTPEASTSVAYDNAVFATRGVGGATGMDIENGSFILDGNRISGDGATNGIVMDSPGKGYRGDIVTHVGTAFIGGTDLGNNGAF